MNTDKIAKKIVSEAMDGFAAKLDERANDPRKEYSPALEKANAIIEYLPDVLESIVRDTLAYCLHNDSARP